MKPSTMKACRLARLAIVCSFAMGILFMVSSSKPWDVEAGGLVGNADREPAGSTLIVNEGWPISNSFHTKKGAENSRIPELFNRAALSSENSVPFLTEAAPLLALNKIHVTNPDDPIPSGSNQPSATWQLGVSITYVLTLTNSGGANSHVSVTDTLPSGFVFISAKCTPSFFAGCPSAVQGPPSGGILTLGEFNMPNGSVIELRITGYFKTTGSQVNKAVASAKDNSGNPIPNVGTANPNGGRSNETDSDVTVPPATVLPNLKVVKTVSPTATSFPAHLDYTIEVTNTTTTGVYLGGILTIRDNISAPSGYTWSVSLLPCVPTGGAICPDLPTSVSGSSTQILFGYSATNSGWLPGGASYKIKFSVDVDKTATCGPSTISFSNQVSLDFSSGITDAVSTDNWSSVQTTITTGFTTICPPPPAGPTVTKQQIDPSSGLPVTTANWNSPVKYRVTISNPTGAAVSIWLLDHVQGVSTPAFTATVTSVPSCVGCTSLSIPVLQTPNTNVTSSGTFFSLWNATAVVPAQSVGQTAVIEYTVVYKPTCETDDVDNVIINRISGGGSWMDVSSTLPDWNMCELKVDKTKVTTGPILFGQPFTYKVVFTNLSTTTPVNAFVRDVLSIKSNRYGSFLVDSSVSCSASSGTITPVGVVPLLPFTKALTGATVVHKPVGWRGLRLLDEYLRFDPGAVLTCQVTIKPQQPASTNPFCQGADDPVVATDDIQLINYAYIDPANFNENSGFPPKFNSSQAADLPLCRNLIVKKVANGQKFGPGATIDYTISVQNVGDDPVHSFTLTDLIPLPLKPLTPTSVSSCSPTPCTSGPSLTGQLLNVQYGPLSPNNNPVSFVLKVLAPQAGGPYPNEAVGTFLTGGNFFFHGDPDFLRDGENIDVLTPKLTKLFDPVQIGPNGTSTLTFNITNTNSDPKQTGISFLDTLPPGLQIVSVISNGCGGTVTPSTDGHTVNLTGGQLVGPNADGSGKHSCQISVKVRASGECGVYTNNKDNFSQVENLDVTNTLATLTVSGCDDPQPGDPSCGVKTKEISCNTDGTGGYLYTFTVTNNTGRVVTDVLVTPKPNSGITITPQQPPLPSGGLDIGASQTWTVNINGGKPNEKACFTVTLMTADGECCSTEVCPVLPECCAAAKDVSIECNKDGTFTYTLSIVNTGVNPIEHMYLYPPAGVTMTPNYFAASVKPGDTFTTKVTIKGAKPGDRLCFDISLHTANMESCCKGQLCIVLPDCKLTSVR